MVTYCGNPSTVQQLAEVVKFNPNDLFTPLNIDEAKGLFIRGLNAGFIVEPLFEYDEKFLAHLYEREDAFREAKSLFFQYLSIDEPSTPIDYWLKNLIARRCAETEVLLRLAYSISHQDPEQTNSLLTGLYKAPSKESLDCARSALLALQKRKSHFPIRPEVSPFTYRSQQIVSTLQRLIDAYGFPGWKAELNPLSVEVSTYAIGKKIFIPANLQLDENELTKLAAREVECHVRGIVNTEHLLRRLMSEATSCFPIIPWLSKSVDEEAYQAVAKQSDIETEISITGNGIAESPNPWYILAIDYASQGHSFGETGTWLFNTMLDVLNITAEEAAEKAWRIIYRLFRGKTAYSSPAQFCTADAARYNGYLRLNLFRSTDADFYQAVSHFSSLSLDELVSLNKACGEAGISKNSLFSPRYDNQYLSTKNTPIPGQTSLV